MSQARQVMAAMAATGACVLATIAGLAPDAVGRERIPRGTAFVPGPGVAAGEEACPLEFGVVGTLYFSEDSNGTGLYELDQLDGSSGSPNLSDVTSTTVGLAPGVDGELFGSRPSGLLRIQLNGEGGVRTGSLLMEGLAYDALGRRLFGTANTSFFRVDTQTGGVLETLPSPGVDLEGLAFGFDTAGAPGVYGLVGFGGPETALYFFDLGSMSWSERGDTGIDWSHVGLAYDDCNGVLYAKGSQDPMLYRLCPGGFGVDVQAIGDTGISRGGGLAWIGECPGPPCTDADIDGDGVIGFGDVLAILGSFGDCPGGACIEPGSCEKGYEPGCGGDPECACVLLFDGTVACHRDFGCGEPCPDGTCPPGFHCVRDSCCGPAVCAPDEAICGDAGDPCDEDVDGSGTVDFGDLLAVLAQWGPCQLPPGACCVFKEDAGYCVDGVTRDECKAMQGSYQGDGTDCVDVQCK